ncbi:MAG: nitroreductase family protein [Planctomycetaceae bacterium]|nr:nitroreductase family protein [Planctomycetaceae bacterium]
MNPVLQTLLDRRSIRKYTDKPISAADRDAILQAGLHAPSAKNTQAWHITVVEKPDVIQNITREVKAAILRAGVTKYEALAKNDNYSVNFRAAPLFVITSANPDETSCPAEDCAVLLENMFLAAHSLGIGSCWINQLGCVTDEPEFRKFLTSLGVPTANKVQGSACFGYADGPAPKAPPRREGTVNHV